MRDIADALVIFGATGDLARKKLHPALFRLAAQGRLGVPVGTGLELPRGAMTTVPASGNPRSSARARRYQCPRGPAHPPIGPGRCCWRPTFAIEWGPSRIAVGYSQPLTMPWLLSEFTPLRQ
jgi:Glucose-6-phosphate dehydrogenase, NAD binding domain